MKLLSSRLEVVCRSTDRDWGRIQLLQKAYYFLGIRFWRTTIDTETIPTYAVIEYAALGFTTWKSKWNERPQIWWKTDSGYKQYRS